MNPWEYDIDKTIHNYSYTLLSSKYMNRIFESDEFQDMDTESITLELLSGLRIISFKDHLKRYIYLKAGLKNALHKDFEEVTDSEFQRIVTSSFKFRRSPYSMTTSSVRPSSAAQRWLSQECVTRSSVFLLGFGLGMSEQDVSEFLTKVINEEDFVFDNPDEVIYWYCYHFHLPYAKAKQYKQDYDLIPLDENADEKHFSSSLEQIDVTTNFKAEIISEKSLPSYWEQIISSSDFESRGESYLTAYLSILKNNTPKDERNLKVYQEFVHLYDSACEQIATCYSLDEKSNKKWSAEDITPSDLEKYLCCGIPLSKNGNVKRKSSSLLSKHFSAKRMTRQTFDAIFSGKLKPNRFDLISLNFLICALRDFEMAPEDRLKFFIDETNPILNRCHMRGLYSANAYECFLLLCLLSEEPLAFYSDVLEYTYEPT